MSTFWILLEQMELFVIYILAGVILVKSRLFNRETLQPISKFVLRMGLPLLIFTNIINGVERNVLLSSGSVLMSAFLFYVAMFFYQYGDRTDISRKRKNGADLSDHEHVWKYRIYGDPHYHQYLSGKRHFVRVGIFHC